MLYILRFLIVISLGVALTLLIWVLRGAKFEDLRPRRLGHVDGFVRLVAALMVLLVWLAFGPKLFDGLIQSLTGT